MRKMFRLCSIPFLHASPVRTIGDRPVLTQSFVELAVLETLFQSRLQRLAGID
jgi:hypothetical protein